ncbi:hypothetical protein MTO96_005143 [Rhipicephalus appendiculatus]
MIKKTMQQRARQYNMDVGISSVSTVSTTLTSNTDLLREVVRVVVREELQRMQLAQGHPTMPALADVVREEVRQTIFQPQPQVYFSPHNRSPSLSYGMRKLYDRTHEPDGTGCRYAP